MNGLRRCYAALPIHAHDLLLARDNSRFYDRGDFGRLDERLGGNAFFVQETISAGQRQHRDRPCRLFGPRCRTAGDFAQHLPRHRDRTIRSDLHDRHRCLRRNTRNLSPDKFV